MAKEYINEYIELSKFEELAERQSDLVRTMTALDWDRYKDWCKDDEEVETLRHTAYLAIKKYNDVITSQKAVMRETMYEKLDYADDHMRKPGKRFWNIFR